MFLHDQGMNAAQPIKEIVRCLWWLITPGSQRRGVERAENIVRVLTAVLDDLPLENDALRLFDGKSGALDVIGKICLEECEIFASYSGRRRICNLHKRAAVELDK